MTWSAARRQCWRWGGELAFPLSSEADECSTRIYSSSQEEVVSPVPRTVQDVPAKAGSLIYYYYKMLPTKADNFIQL